MPCYYDLGISRLNEMCSAMNSIQRMVPESDDIAARLQRYFANLTSPATVIEERLRAGEGGWGPVGRTDHIEFSESPEDGELELRNTEVTAAVRRRVDDLVFALMAQSDYSDNE